MSTVALTLLASVASAGGQLDVPVTVDLDGMTAQGNQVTARTSKNDVEIIGCGIKAFDDGTGSPFTYGFCQARDSEDVFINCLTFSADLLEALKANSAYTFIRFDWNEFGDCTRIDISTNSFYVPNFTTKGKN